MTREVHLGLDVGGTASRWVACDDRGAVVTRGKVAGATGHIFNPAEKQRLSAVLMALSDALLKEGLKGVRLTAGITGYGAAVIDEAKALISETLALAPDSIALLDDIVLAYAASFSPGEGHLISAGTGSIGVHITRSGETIRVGGRGILIDDAGSGSWIALQALNLMYRAHDHDGSFKTVDGLASHIFTAVGGDSWSDVRQFVYGGDRGRIGGLSTAVAQAAHAGDATALGILRQAGQELAKLAEALLSRCGAAPVRLVGGVLGLHPVILQEILASLPGKDVAFTHTDAALTAATLHSDPDWASALTMLE